MTHTMSAAPEISRLTHAVASAAPAASSKSEPLPYRMTEGLPMMGKLPSPSDFP